jgi:hypothetical protein
MDKSAPVVIGRAWTEGEATVIKSLLESYDIPCHYTSELAHRLYPVSPDNPGPIRIFVPAAFAQEAKDILDESCRNQPRIRPAED